MPSTNQAGLLMRRINKEATLIEGQLILGEFNFQESQELRYFHKGTCIAAIQSLQTASGRQLSVTANCSIKITQPIAVNEFIISSQGSLCFETSVAVSEKCMIQAKAIRCRQAQIQCSGKINIETYALIVSSQSDVRLEGNGDEKSSECIVITRSRVSTTSRLVLDKVQYQTPACKLTGKMYCKESHLTIKSLSQSGLLSLKKSTIVANKYHQLSAAKTVLSSSIADAAVTSLQGELIAKRSHLKGGSLLVSQGSMYCQKSSVVLFSKSIVMLKEATCTISHSKLLCLSQENKLPSSIDIHANATFRKAVISTDVMSCQSQRILIEKNTKLYVNQSLRMDLCFSIKESSIQARQLFFNGEGCLKSSSLRSEELLLAINKGEVLKTRIRCNHLNLRGGKSNALQLSDTRMIFSALRVSGKVYAKSGSEMTGICGGKGYHEITGVLTLENSSLQCAGQVYSSSESELRLLSSDTVVPNWVCESRLLETTSGALLTQSLLKSEGEMRAEAAFISVAGVARLSGVKTQLSKDSSLKARNIYVVNGSVVTADKSSVLAKETLYTGDGTSLVVNKTTLQAESEILLGNLEGIGCQFFSRNLTVGRQAKAEKSSFLIKENLVFDLMSGISLEGSITKAKNWQVHGGLSQKNTVVLAENTLFSETSHITDSGRNIIKGKVCEVKGKLTEGEEKEEYGGCLIAMTDQINFHKTAYVSGSNPIKIETRSFSQMGRIESESQLECKVNSFVNKGHISADTIDIKADRGVLNRGSMAAKRIAVTGSFVNLLGAVDAEESINIVGPVSANILGRISSAHYVSSSFLSLPMGLSLSNFKLNRGCLNQYTLYSMLQTASLIFFGPSIPLLGAVFSILGLMSSTTIGLSSAAQVGMIYASSQSSYLRPYEWYPAIGAAAQVIKSAFLDFKVLRNFWRTVFNPWRIPDGDRAPADSDNKEDDNKKKNEDHKKDKEKKDKGNKKGKKSEKDKEKKDKESEKPSEHPYWDMVLAKALGVKECWIRQARGWIMYASSVASNWDRFSALTVLSPLLGVHSNNALLSMNAGLGFHSTEFDTLVFSTDMGAHFRVNGITETVFLFNASARYGVEESLRSVWMVQMGQVKALDNAALLATYFWNKGGSAEAANLRLEFGRMDNPEAVIRGEGEWAKYKASKALIYSSWNEINLQEEILRQCGLVLTGISVDFNVDYKTEKGVVQLNSTNGEVAIHSEVSATHVGVNSAAGFLNEGSVGAKTFAVRAQGDVLNKGVLAAEKFGYVEAGGDIINQCTEEKVQGAHGPDVKYTPAYIVGGTGDGNGGPGLVLKAKGKIKCDASVIASQADNVLIADQGFEFTERHNRYISYHHKHSTCFSLNRDEVTEWSTRVQRSLVHSEHGKNIFISKHGGLVGKAAIFEAAKGNYADVKQGISLQALKTKTTRQSKQGAIIFPSDTTRDDEGLVWTDVHADGFSQFRSRDGNVDFGGAYASGKGSLALIAPHGKVIFDDEVLNHHVRQSRFSMGVTIPCLAQMQDVLTGSKHPTSLDPTADKLRKLAKSRKGLEWLVNGTSAGISAYNAANAIGRGMANDTLGAEALKRYGLGGEGGISPNARLSLGWSKSDSHYQTKGGCGVNIGGNLYIQAGKGVEMNHGVQVHADGNVDVDAPSIIANGVELLSDYKTSEVGASVSGGLTSATPTGVGVSASKSSGTASNYSNAVLSAGGNMRLHYGRRAMKYAELNGARLEAESFDGGIEELHVTDHLSSYTQKSSSVSVDSSGNVSGSKSSASGSYVAQSSGIFSKEGFNTNGHDFHIGHAYMTGGAIESVAEGSLSIDVLEATSVPESHDSTSIGIAFNLNDFERLHGKEPTGETGEKAIASVDVSKDKRHYRANRLPYVGNAQINALQGNVARTKDDILQVWMNRKCSVVMSVPITNAAYLAQSKEHINYLRQAMFPPTYTYINDDLANSMLYWEKQRQLLNNLFKVDFSSESVESVDGKQYSLYNKWIAAVMGFVRAGGDWRFERVIRALAKVKFMRLYAKLRSMLSASSFDALIEACQGGSNIMTEAGMGVFREMLGNRLITQLVQQFYYEEVAGPIAGSFMAATGILDAFTYNAARNQAWINSGRDMLATFGGRNASGVEAVENSLRAFYLMVLASWSNANHTAHELSEKLAQEVIDAAQSIYNAASSAKQENEEALSSSLGFFSSTAQGGKAAKKSTVGVTNTQGAPEMDTSFSNQQAAEYALSLASVTTGAAWVASADLTDEREREKPTLDCTQPLFTNCVKECIAREVNPRNFYEEDEKCFQQCIEEFCVER